MRVPDQTPGGWYWSDDPASALIAPAVPQVLVEENPVIATIYGPKGEPIVSARARSIIPFGFRKGT